jgi:hypothetical protein
MAVKFNLTTIPHTGTRFLNQLFFRMGFSNIQVSTDHIVRRPENVNPEGTNPIEYLMYHWFETPTPNGKGYDIDWKHMRRGVPVVTTLRHPHEVALSWMGRDKKSSLINYEMGNLLRIYDNLIGASAALSMRYVDLNCKKGKRLDHIIATIKSLGDDVYEHADKDVLTNYVNEWLPVGNTSNDLKAYYYENGHPPDVYNWKRFDRAVNWYNKKLKECMYDNFSP